MQRLTQYAFDVANDPETFLLLAALSVRAGVAPPPIVVKASSNPVVSMAALQRNLTPETSHLLVTGMQRVIHIATGASAVLAARLEEALPATLWHAALSQLLEAFAAAQLRFGEHWIYSDDMVTRGILTPGQSGPESESARTLLRLSNDVLQNDAVVLTMQDDFDVDLSIADRDSVAGGGSDCFM
ncbi:MAG: hypothetical protein MHM6MM_005670 [Cercozoa sp. M6MM]